MTVDLAAFLRARYDEDEARAKAAGGDSWRRQDHPSDTVAIYDSKGEPVVYDEGWPTEEQAAHIVRHDPARVLADIESKRRIVDRYAWLRKHGDTGGAVWVLQLLALPHADHPDYREKWRP